MPAARRRSVADRALLVGVTLAAQDPRESQSSLDELARLAESAGAEVVGRVQQQRRSLDPATYIGAGKLEELGKLAASGDASLVVFDDELKPSQQRNIEEALGLAVLDRTQLILDVFATRASTNEGRLQVELAQLSYLLPRLMGMGKVLSRQGGGIGSRGPGESKLESDRRRLRDRIALLGRELDQVARARGLQRAKRRRSEAKVIALAGYTNAGKSSLFNALTSAKVYAADRLFATLDPTVRPLFAEGEAAQALLLVDTVGFVRKLPHALVAAFRATLEEVAEADLILRLVDADEADWQGRLASVDAVLKEVFELYLPGKELPPRLLAFNKVDLLGPARLKALKAQEPQASFVSAASGEGLQALKLRLRGHFEEDLKVQAYLIPHERLGELSRQFPKLRIIKQQWLASGLKVEAVLSQALPALEPFRLKPAKRKP
jgi:GTP-binding protein HflX